MTYRFTLVRGSHDHVGLSVTTWDTVTDVDGETFRTSKHGVEGELRKTVPIECSEMACFLPKCIVLDSKNRW